jgi:hypothetical protein
VILVIAILLIPAFVFWVGRQERLGKPALIPNSLWKNIAFTCTCIAVFFTWAVFNAFQYFSALYFERVQGLTVLDTSIRFLPMVVTGAATNIVRYFQHSVLRLLLTLNTGDGLSGGQDRGQAFGYMVGCHICHLPNTDGSCQTRMGLLGRTICGNVTFSTTPRW